MHSNTTWVSIPIAYLYPLFLSSPPGPTPHPHSTKNIIPKEPFSILLWKAITEQYQIEQVEREPPESQLPTNFPSLLSPRYSETGM